MINKFDNPEDAKQFIDRLIYEEEDHSKVISELKKINDPKLLFMFACKYNWDDGFSIPFEIIKNPCCDMSTALVMFDMSCGYEFFAMGEGINGVLNSPQIELYDADPGLVDFVKETYHRIVKNDFAVGQTEYAPEVVQSKVQTYKLKKINPEIPEVFFNGIKF
jgi:hypothetical protein